MPDEVFAISSDGVATILELGIGGFSANFIDTVCVPGTKSTLTILTRSHHQHLDDIAAEVVWVGPLEVSSLSTATMQKVGLRFVDCGEGLRRDIEHLIQRLSPARMVSAVDPSKDSAFPCHCFVQH